MKRVAVVYRGGISYRQSRFQGTRGDGTGDYVDFEQCLESINRNLHGSNTDWEIDTYIHCWNFDLKNSLMSLLRPIGYNFPNYRRYKLGILIRTILSYINLLRSDGISAIKSKMRLNIFRREFAGISQALSIKLGLSLIPEHKLKSYDLIVLLRPDVLLKKQIFLSDYNASKITLNNSGNLRGDFRFIFSPDFVSGFLGLYNSVFFGNFHSLHSWIPKYLVSLYGDVVVEDNIVAGVDEEVMRKLSAL